MSIKLHSYLLGKTNEKNHLYSVRYTECRTKWFESLLKFWKYLAKKEPLPLFIKNKLIFIDDLNGTIGFSTII